MTLIRKKASEHDCANLFVQHVILSVDWRWTEVYRNLRETFGTDFRVIDEELAKFDLTLGLIALDMRAINNLFPSDRAYRLRTLTLENLNSLGSQEYCETEINKYCEAWAVAYEGEDPRDALVTIPARLLEKWLGVHIHHFAVPTDAGDIIDPSLLLHVTGVLMQFVGYWKEIRNSYRLVP